jgi:hypothetical protein
MVWVLGLLAVCAFAPQQNFRRILGLIFISAGIGQFIYPWLYLDFQQGGFYAVAAHTIRILTLLWATAIAWQNMNEISQQNPSPKAIHPAS